MWGSEKNVGKNVTLITAKAEIQGDIRISEALQIEGVVKGNILADPDSSAEVTIGVKGVVEGEIRAPRIVINGEVRGDIYASEHLTLNKNGLVTGNVHYVMMEMVMGAKVNGSLLHVASEGKKAKKAVSEAPAVDVPGNNS
ncbi:bactofilin family protein [Reinekea marinisedimentorum]|uniref:Cytoskeletal protein CcmA (Bactofilin family) n=1 Tax=Reinekea marinisedimentorum TaxID=230495 RepID=A0A4R3HSM2_9GAMM|nr:polymer-forming cytoskeletal protein [Reinekea marinisedimentorum]TCS36147.1 cytoskeletal protein CcmA (bactofilin family) [Reinekea marinisedimentorum]